MGDSLDLRKANLAEYLRRQEAAGTPVSARLIESARAVLDREESTMRFARFQSTLIEIFPGGKARTTPDYQPRPRTYEEILGQVMVWSEDLEWDEELDGEPPTDDEKRSMLAAQWSGTSATQFDMLLSDGRMIHFQVYPVEREPVRRKAVRVLEAAAFLALAGLGAVTVVQWIAGSL